MSRGHDVTVLCGLPNVSMPEGEQGIVPREYHNGKKRHQIHNGVRIIRSFEIGRRSGPFWRMLNYLSFWKSASRKVLELEDDFDITFAYQLSPATMCIPAQVLKKKKDVPYLLYCCDAWPEWIRAVLGDKFTFLANYFGKVCRSMYCDADKLVVQTPSYLDYYSDYYGIDRSKLSYIPQFSTDNAGISSLPHDGINLLFAGNMGILQCVPLILEAFLRCSDIEDFYLHFVGDGSELENAKEFVSSKGLADRVYFHGRKQLDAMSSYYGLADMCVLALDSSTLIASTIPSKLQGYMSAGKPVVAAIDGGARFVIEESNCGIVVTPGDVEALSDAMRRMATDRNMREEFGQNARAYYDRFFTQNAYVDAIEQNLLAISKRGNS